MKSLLSPFVLLGILLCAPYALATTGDAETAQQESEQKSDEASENPATSTEAQVLPEAEAEEASAASAEADEKKPSAQESQAEMQPPVEPTVVSKPPSNSIESIEVRAQKRRESESEFEGGFRIGEKVLDTFEYDDIHRILSAAPGVYYREEDGYGLRPNIGMRGVSSDRSKKVVIMEDGVLIAPAPYAAPAGYYFPLTTRLGAVEIYKGPTMLPYGPNTLGGAINLVTAPMPYGPVAEFDLELGQDTFGRLHARVGDGGDNWSYFVDMAHLETDGFKVVDGGGKSGYLRNDILFKGRWDSDPAGSTLHRVDIKAGYGDETSNETYLGLTAEDFEATPLRRYRASYLDEMNWERTQIQIDYSADFESGLELRLTGYRHDFYRVWEKANGFWGDNSLFVPGDAGYGSKSLSLSEIFKRPEAFPAYMSVLRGESPSGTIVQAQPGEPWANPDLLLVGANARTYYSHGLQLNGRWNVSLGETSHDIRFGTRLHQDSVRRDEKEEPLFMSENGELISIGVPGRTYGDNTDRADALSAFLYDVLEWRDFSFIAGTRVEYVEMNREDRLSDSTNENSDLVILPGAGATWYILPSLSLDFGIHRGYSPVSPGQADSTKPSSSLLYETSISYDDRGFFSEVLFFLSDYSNLVGQAGQSGGAVAGEADVQYNAGSARIMGLEASYGYALALPAGLSMPSTLAYTFTDARFVEPTDNTDPLYGGAVEGDYLPYVPMHQLSATVGLEHEKASLTFSLGHQSAMRDAPGQEPIDEALATTSRWVLDAAARFNIAPRLTVYIKGDNITDETYIVSHRPYGIRPGKPMRWYLGLKGSYD